METVAILSETDYADLPSAARERLGIDNRQKNFLVRVSFRSFDRTLTDVDAHAIRDRIHNALPKAPPANGQRDDVSATRGGIKGIPEVTTTRDVTCAVPMTLHTGC